jgi:HPr kinase/phosphorylase
VKKPQLTVRDLFEAKETILELELLTPGLSLDRSIEAATLSNPGIVLAGFTERFLTGRVQVLGETEIRFLETLSAEQCHDTLERFLMLGIPALFVTKKLEVPVVLPELCILHDVPLFRSSVGTGEFYRRLQPYLEDQLAPTATLHGSLADVYGVGLLFMGRSGIGKSECVLDLIERGHRLVADDMVIAARRGNDVIIGRGPELQMHHMEIRGIGIIDIRALFGIRAIRQQKRIEVIVQLVDLDTTAQYDRTGLDKIEAEILGVKIPKVIVPLVAGKNITVISEIVAMNHLLKFSGVNSAELFNERLQAAMRPVRQYLEEDYE